MTVVACIAFADINGATIRFTRRMVAMTVGRTHCSQARRVRRQLDRRLAETAARVGGELGWTLAEELTIDLILDAYDRKHELTELALACTDPKDRRSVLGEVRLTESHIANLLKRLKIEPDEIAPAAPMSPRSARASRAANQRWHRPGGKLGNPLLGATPIEVD
jgi:hypothetical protein